jgi:hypothetical protein
MVFENFVAKVKGAVKWEPDLPQKPLGSTETVPPKVFKSLEDKQKKTEKACAEMVVAKEKMTNLVAQFNATKKEFEEKSKTAKLTAFDGRDGKRIFYTLSNIKENMENRVKDATDLKKIGDENLSNIQTQYSLYLSGIGGENLKPALNQIAAKSGELQSGFGEVSAQNKSAEIQKIIDTLYS